MFCKDVIGVITKVDIATEEDCEKAEIVLRNAGVENIFYSPDPEKKLERYLGYPEENQGGRMINCEIINNPTKGTLKILARRIADREIREKLNTESIESIALIQGRVSKIIAIADDAEKTADVTARRGDRLMPSASYDHSPDRIAFCSSYSGRKDRERKS